MYATSLERKVTTLLTELAACLCAEVSTLVEQGEMEPLCFCGVVPGNEVPFDYADNGMAWVRLSLITPMESLDGVSSRCATEYDVTIQMGMLRCAPTVDDYGNLPSVQDMLRITEAQSKDMGVMWKALTCCNPSVDAERTLIEYLPVGPEGLVIGGSWTSRWRL